MNKPAGLWTRLGAFTNDFERGEWRRLAVLFEAAGLEVVQLSVALLAEVIEDPAIIPGVRRLLADHGLSIAALGAYRNLVSADPDKRRRNIAFVKASLVHAAALGTRIVSTETGTLHPTGDWSGTPLNRTPQAWEALYNALDELLPAAEAAQTVLALEGYVNNVLQTPDQLAELLRRYSSPYLKVMCDPYNFLTCDRLADAARLSDEFLARFKDQFVIAHLKDVSPQGAEIETPEFGLGVFPQAGYLEFLEQQRPDLPLIFEHLPNEHLPAAIQRLVEIHSNRS